MRQLLTLQSLKTNYFSLFYSAQQLNTVLSITVTRTMILVLLTGLALFTKISFANAESKAKKEASLQVPQFFYEIFSTNQRSIGSTGIDPMASTLRASMAGTNGIERIAGKTGEELLKWSRTNGSQFGTMANEVEDFFRYQPRSSKEAEIAASKNSAGKNSENYKSQKQISEENETHHKFGFQMVNLNGQALARYEGWFKSKLVYDAPRQSLNLQFEQSFDETLKLSLQNNWTPTESTNSMYVNYSF